MTERRSRRNTARFQVEAADGQRFEIVETTTFVVLSPLSGPLPRRCPPASSTTAAATR